MTLPSEGDWIDAHDNLALVGPSGVGKSWLACAIGQKACRDNRSVLYHRWPKLCQDMALARGDGRHPRLIKSLGRADLLILDDFGLEPLDAGPRHDLLEILEERYGRLIDDRHLPAPARGVARDHWRPQLPALDHALRRFSDTSLAFIEKSLTPVKAETEPIDTRAAANLDEDLDWRMAKTADGWRAFLAKHPNGNRARDAQAELDKLTKPTGPPPAPQAPKFAPVVEVANARPPAPDFFAALERPPPPETERFSKSKGPSSNGGSSRRAT